MEAIQITKHQPSDCFKKGTRVDAECIINATLVINDTSSITLLISK